MRIFFVIVITSILFGCGATSGTNPKIIRNDFDNSNRVYIQPHGGKCSMTSCLGIGAQWDSKSPDNIFWVFGLLCGK